jgi:hypothetical protein
VPHLAAKNSIARRTSAIEEEKLQISMKQLFMKRIKYSTFAAISLSMTIAQGARKKLLPQIHKNSDRKSRKWFVRVASVI